MGAKLADFFLLTNYKVYKKKEGCHHDNQSLKTL